MFSRMRSDRGTAILEFALVAALLMMLVFGVIQFGFAYHVQQGLQAGAREGARVASLPQTTTAQIKDRVRDAVSGVDMSPANEQCPPTRVGSYCITVTPAAVNQPCNLADGREVTVEVEHRTQLDIPLWTSEIVLVGKGVFRCES